MSLFLWIICIYIFLGVVSIVISVIKEPMWLCALYMWYLLPIILPLGIMFFPYVLWETFKPEPPGGRWI